MIKRFCLFLFITILCSCYIFSLDLMILHTNDHHGSLFNYWLEFNQVAGLAERAILINQIKENNENVLILDAGDMNTGIYESNLFVAEPDILAYNLIGYDAVTLGNHEFYGDIERVTNQISTATFPFLSANIFNQNNELIGLPYQFFTMQNGLQVAVLGLTTTHKSLHDDFIVKCDVEIANELVPILREKADIVIALTHLGIYDFGGEQQYGSIRLALNTTGIDLIIDGDSHTLLEQPAIINGVPIVQAGERGRYLGKAILNFDVETGEVNLNNWEAIPLMRAHNDPEFEADIEIQEMLESYRQKAIDSGNALLGVSDRDFRNININNRIVAIGRVVGQAMLESFPEHNIDVGMYNSGGIRGDLLRGEIRVSHIHNVMPFENNLVILEMPGTLLSEIIRDSYIERINTGAFLQYSNNVGIVQRPGDIVIPNLNGVDLVPDKIYRVATNSFVASGRENPLFTLAEIKIDTGITTRQALINYIQTAPFFKGE